VISRLELLLLLSASDRDANLDSLQSLITRRLVTAVVNGDAITAIRTTAAGDCALRAMTLPASKE
jgi:hypothetical protein